MSNSSHVINKSKNILILMSGSIACYKICSLISKLSQNNFNVKVVMSESAQKFVGTATIEGLSHNNIHTDTFAAGHAMDHIYLDRWADLVLLAPASANSINKIANGFGDDLISTLFLAHDFKKPFLVAPAMNTNMYLHPTTQKSISTLKNLSVEILETASGVLACGEFGYGRLLESDLIYSEIISRLEKITTNENFLPEIQKNKSLKILVTSGGTQVPIDDVRVITNNSTGKTAATITDQLIIAGFQVVYLCAKNAIRPDLDCRTETYLTYADLDNQITKLLDEKFDVVIHTAAVSDYSVANLQSGKINSTSETLQINLVKNPKLIDKIKFISPKSLLVGFKLTSKIDETEIQKKIDSLFTNAQCDFVVQNDLKTVHTDKHIFNLYSKKLVTKNLSIFDLSYLLVDSFIKKELL